MRNIISKFLFTLLALSLGFGQMWGDVTLFTADFSAAAWDGVTFSQGNTDNYDVINGITFHSKNSSKQFSISGGVLTWPNNNMSSNNYYLGFPVTGINEGSITISVWDGSTATRVKYMVKNNEDAFSANIGSSGTNTNSASPTTVTVSSLGTKAFVYLGRQGSGLTTITKIVVTTPNPSCAAGDPGNISKGTLSAGVLTLNAAGSAASGDTWYWQSSATGTDKTNSGSSYDVDEAGTYYIRSYNTAADCWSDAKSITISASDFAAHYAITYNPGTGGSGTIAADEKVHDVAFTLSSEMFTRTGYVQVGWALSDGGTKAYDLGGSYTANEAEEFFPVWAEKDTYAAAFACSASAPAGWTFSTDDGWADNKTIAAYVCKFTENSVPAPGDNGMNENWVAFAKNTSAVATYDLGYATTISALNVTLYGGSSSAFNQTIEFVGADGTTVKKTYTNSLSAGNWLANNISKTDVVPNVRYIKVYGASKWVVMSAFSVTYGDLSTKYTVTYNLNGGTGTTPTQSALAAGKTFTLHNGTTGITAPTDKIFSNWKDQDDALFAGGTTYTMPAKNVTLTAQWADASSTYDVTYNNGGHGTAPDAENDVLSVVLAELSADGWAHKGWTASEDVTVDAATVEAGTLIANGKTAILASDVTFTAVWSEIYTVTYNANGGSCGTASATWTDGDAALVLPTATKENFDFIGWYDAATGGNKIASPYTPTASIEVFAHYVPTLLQAIYSNTFDAFIKNQAVNVYYLQGESAPTLSSIKVKGVETPVFEEVDGNIKVTVSEVDYIYPVTKTAVAPYAGTGEKETFSGSDEEKAYIKTGYSYSGGWRFSKTDDDWSRETPGNTRLYFFVGAADHFTLESTGTSRNMKVYRNGVLLDEPTASGSNPSIAGSNAPAMYAIVSNQAGGDGKFTAITIAPWVATTGVTLKEGTTPISSKEIYATASFTLTAEVTPDNASNKTITWTSSNDAIATVVNGVVTGVAANASPVTITASTVDGVTATCEVTVTAAPEPSAAPTITTQPASTNYYEGATIAALEVVATGESLTYQWYLGSDPIDGATNATYTPTVTAIGSYVYHCVVTNTEAGHLPTSLASSDATIAIADDPAAIKLFDGEGNLNTTNFISPAKTTIEISEVTYTCLAEFSSNRTSLGGATPADMVQYNATTDAAMIKMTFYNNNSGVKKAILYKYEEGAEAPEKIEIEVPGQTIFTTDYYTFNSSKNRSFYVCMNDRSNIRVLQVKVIDNGANPVKQFGQIGYSLNLNKGRLYAKDGVEKTFEGLTLTASSEYKVYNNSNLATKAANSFTIASPVIMHVERSGGKYYVYQDPEDKGTLYSANADIELNTTGTWYISSETASSATSFTKIAFAAPKCAEPSFAALANSDVCEGDGYVALNGTATVADAGVPTYQWYNADGDEAIDGATAAEFTPTADGSYYVIATNHLADHSDNAKQSATVTVTTYASAQITSAPVDVRQKVGEDATLTVVASGKAPLSYQWYTCDENGDNTAIIAGAENASYTVNVTANLDQYYKVVVTSGCGEASAVARIVEWVALPQLSVSTTTTWDWTNISDQNITLTDQTVPAKNEECVLANVKVGDKMPTNDETFNSQALLFYGEHVRNVESGRAYASIGHIKFTTTVAGKVTVEFSDNGTNNRKLKINDALSESSASKTDIKTFSVVVPAGEVTIEGVKSDGTGSNQYIRISKIIFSTTDVDGADYTRNVTEGRYGTICLPKAGVMVGATIYEAAYRDLGVQKIFFDEVINGEMEAGKPYLFLPKEGTTQLGVYYTSSAAPVAATHYNGFYGYYDIDHLNDGETAYPYNVQVGEYLVYNNQYVMVNGTNSYLAQFRAYIVMSEMPTHGSAPAPGRRRVAMGYTGTNTATGVDNIESSDAPVKVMIDGQLYILCGEKMYDATGRLVK